MDEPRMRPATAADVAVIARTVDHAYRHYIARMGRPPAPMLDDHAARVAEGVVSVIEETRRGTEVGYERVFMRKRLLRPAVAMLPPSR